MKLILEIEMDNDAMRTRRDVASLLERAASYVQNANEKFHLLDRNLMDANGNTVGFVRVVDDE